MRGLTPELARTNVDIDFNEERRTPMDKNSNSGFPFLRNNFFSFFGSSHNLGKALQKVRYAILDLSCPPHEILQV